MDKIDWFNLFVWVLGLSFCVIVWYSLWLVATYTVLGKI